MRSSSLVLLLTACEASPQALPTTLVPAVPLTLTAQDPGTVERGQPVDLIATGATPGDRGAFVFAQALQANGTCPPGFLDCLDLANAQLIATTVVDPAGTLQATAVPPAGSRYLRGYVQALSWAAGAPIAAVGSPPLPVFLRPAGCGVDITITTEVVAWASEIGWRVEAANGSVATGVPYGAYTANNTTYVEQITLTEGVHRFLAQDAFGDGWHRGSVVIETAGGTELLRFEPLDQTFASRAATFDVPCVP